MTFFSFQTNIFLHDSIKSSSKQKKVEVLNLKKGYFKDLVSENLYLSVSDQRLLNTRQCSITIIRFNTKQQCLREAAKKFFH